MTDPDELLGHLRDALEIIEAPPPLLVDAAKASFTWRTVDAELAELIADSLTEPAAALRATEPPRLLTFAVGDTMVVLEVVRDRHECRVTGQIVAPAAADVEVRHSAGVLQTTADADGRFQVAQVAAGPISVRCRFADAARTPLVTSWVSI